MNTPHAPTRSPADGTHHLWGGRFAQAPAQALDALNRSLPVDHRLWPQDVRAAAAWVRALALADVLSADEETVLLEGLDRVAERLADGAAMGAPDEDVHTLVERLLYEETGSVAGKLNTGRSRNDQVATDLRLWTMEALDAVTTEVRALGQVLTAHAAAGVDLLMPGYTHGQPAQPVRWGYVLAAHAWPLTRDLDRLAEAGRRLAELPLGSGAVAGSGIAVDRVFLQEELGFRGISPNALDVTGDRDFVADVLYALSMLATHLSRLAGELFTLQSADVEFIRLDDAWCTGSSLMPQKRNPDVLELVRAKPGRILGDLVNLLSVLRGLPAGYAKDLQEDKAALFDAVDTMLLTLPALRGAVASMTPRPDRMHAALDAAMLATDVADELVSHGVPFREAHEIVGRLVRVAEADGVAVNAVAGLAAAEVDARLPGILEGLGDWEASVERRATAGGASRASVGRQVEQLRQFFEGHA